MDIAPLPIKLVRQKPHGDDCHKCTTEMVFNFYNDHETAKKVWSFLHTYKKHSGLEGVFCQDVGKFALSRGYKVIISHNDWGWWDEDTVKASKKGKLRLIKALKKLKKEKKAWSDKKIIDKEIVFVKKGGIFNFEIPRFENIESCLLQKIPVFLIVRGEFLFRSPDAKYNHSILVIGKKANKYLIRDPLYAIESIDKDELYIAWAKTGGWMMVVEPIPQSLKDKQISLPFSKNG